MTRSIAQIAKEVGGEAVGDAGKMISGAAPFENAGSEDITFAAGAGYLKTIEKTGAGAVIVPKNFESPSVTLIRVDTPQLAFAKVLRLFYPACIPSWFESPGLSSNACIGKDVRIGKDSNVGPFAVIGDNARIGDRVKIHPHAVIGDGVSIGDDTEIFPNVTIFENCVIGNRVSVHAGTVIGSDGFGYAPDGEKYYKIIHRGIVEIGDDVEIGSGNTIDRATFGKTIIGNGVKTDNLVHIAHNVTVGDNTVIVAQVGIAGSVTIGKHAILAGQAGVTGHLSIGDNVIIGPQSGIAKSIPDGQVVSGSPEIPHKLWLRVQRLIPKLPEIAKRVSAIEKRLREKGIFD